MTSCRDVDAMMTPYVDGEITESETYVVESHLAVCGVCRDHATADKAVRQVVQARADLLGERAPSGLQARCIAATPLRSSEHDAVGSSSEWWWRRRVGWAPISMATTVLLAVGVVFVLGQNRQLEAAFVAQMAIDHDRCFGQLDEIATGFDAEPAERVLATEHGLDVNMADESADFDLLDVRHCMYEQGGMAHVLCEWRGEALSLFVVPGRSDREQVLEIVGHEAVVWSQGERAFVLVGGTRDRWRSRPGGRVRAPIHRLAGETWMCGGTDALEELT